MLPNASDDFLTNTSVIHASVGVFRAFPPALVARPPQVVRAGPPMGAPGSRATTTASQPHHQALGPKVPTSPKRPVLNATTSNRKRQCLAQICASFSTSVASYPCPQFVQWAVVTVLAGSGQETAGCRALPGCGGAAGSCEQTRSAGAGSGSTAPSEVAVTGSPSPPAVTPAGSGPCSPGEG